MLSDAFDGRVVDLLKTLNTRLLDLERRDRPDSAAGGGVGDADTLDGIDSTGFALASHALIASHTASGLTTGQSLRATGAASFAFGAIDLTNANAVTGALPVNRGGTALSATPTNGQIPIGNGTNYTLAALTGTANRVTVTNGAGSITLSGPQDIHTGASPTFAALTISGALVVDTTTLTVDATNNRVGIGTATPSELLDILKAAAPAMRFSWTDNTSYGNFQMFENASEIGVWQGIGSNFGAAARNSGIENICVSGPISFWPNNSQFVTLTAAHNVLVGITGEPSGGGTPVLLMAQASGNPTGLPSNTAGIFSKDVAGTCELFAVDEAGNVVQLSPHNFDLYEPDPKAPYPWSFYSANEFIGVEMAVDFARLVAAVEKLSGEKLLHIRNLPDERTKDWDGHQAQLAAQRAEEIDTWDQMEAKHRQAVSDWVNTPGGEMPRRPKGNSPRPEPYSPKAPPAWMGSRLKKGRHPPKTTKP